MHTQTIRRAFLRYFKERGHSIIPSSPVVPQEDPTLLFTNAGMNQFKDVFLGKAVRDYVKATTSQKCIRAGGKHNDLENVGHTSRHLTFFEMLGNFSFGDYFKKEAIRYAWEVSTQVFGFDPDRIWPTVFREDDEAFELWTAYVPAERITRFDEKDNFWAMGETGPCGPCSELLYDRGEAYGSARNPREDLSGERFLEFWNLVFMQYNRLSPQDIFPLPKPSIDTGAGLERILSLQAGVDSLFETDTLRGIIAQIETISGSTYDANDPLRAPPFRVIADHLRSLSFAIADGAQPSNVERGYVLRKILRRAVRYGKSLGLEEPFLANVLPRLIDLMGEDYPELKKGQGRIADILTTEEEAFFRTLRRGGNMLNQVIERARKGDKRISGEEAFKLKDTYGLPIEEIVLIAKDADLQIDQEKYQGLEKEAKERSKGMQKQTTQATTENIFASFAKEKGPSHFVGYEGTSAEGTVVGLLKNGAFCEALQEGEEGIVILNRTPFYAEKGGQIGDKGSLRINDNVFEVFDCISPFKDVIAHVGKMKNGLLQAGDKVIAAIDAPRRRKIANHHTATHLLHWALHEVLGEHVKQAGSVVEPHRLRFDFSHHKALTKEDVRLIEDLVNEKIRENLPVHAYEISYEEAQTRGEIKQFFGEKYGSSVRVVDIDFSKELCGGCHVERLGQIGLFKIEKESGIAAGVRRIEAATGAEAEALVRQEEDRLEKAASLLKTTAPQLQERLEKLLEENRQMAGEIRAAKSARLEQTAISLLSQMEKGSVPLLTAALPLGAEELRQCAEILIEKMESGVVILAATQGEKCHILIRVSDDWVKKGIKALDLIKEIAPIIEGSGGGKAHSAQAGGKAPGQIDAAFAKIRQKLAN